MQAKIEFIENPREVSDIMNKTWGDSIISDTPHLIDPVNLLNRTECGAVAFGAYVKEGNVATGSIKLIDDTTLEIGSLAVLPEARGHGLASQIYSARSPFVAHMYKQGVEITTYATLGSDVIHKIIRNFELMTNESTVELLSFAPFIVEVDTVSCENNIKSPDFYHRRGNRGFISTAKVASMKDRKTNFADLEFKCLHLTGNDNIYLELPINLNLLILEKPELEEALRFKTMCGSKLLQILMPMHKDFENLFYRLLSEGFVFNGFDYIAKYTPAVSVIFSADFNFASRFVKILEGIRSYNIPEFTYLSEQIKAVNKF